MSNQTRPHTVRDGEFDQVMSRYRSTMCNVKASPKLCDAVLAQAKTRADQTREDTAGARGVRSQSTANGRGHTSKQSPWTNLSLSSKRFRVALCIALAAALICAGSIVGWSLSSEQTLSEAQDTQAPEEKVPDTTSEADAPEPQADAAQTSATATPTAEPAAPKQKAITITLNEHFGVGGYSGKGYDPATDRFLEPWTWVGHKSGFSPICTGENIERITYELEGDRGYFEMIAAGDTADGSKFKEGNPYGATPGRSYYYTKSISFDYDKQGFKPEGVVYSIYHHFPLQEEATDLMQGIVNGVYPNTATNHEASDRLDSLIEQGAAQEILRHRLKATFTFDDGSTETRTYLISPVDDFDERYKTYLDTRRDTGVPDFPELYTITQVED